MLCQSWSSLSSSQSSDKYHCLCTLCAPVKRRLNHNRLERRKKKNEKLNIHQVIKNRKKETVKFRKRRKREKFIYWTFQWCSPPPSTWAKAPSRRSDTSLGNGVSQSSPWRWRPRSRHPLWDLELWTWMGRTPKIIKCRKYRKYHLFISWNPNFFSRKIY